MQKEKQEHDERKIAISSQHDHLYDNTVDWDCWIINWLAEYQVEYGNGIDADGLIWATRQSVRSWQHESVYAHDGDELIGGALFVVADDWIFLDRAFIVTEYRGQGIYSRIIREIDGYAEKHGIRGIEVQTWDFEAPHIYEHLGFTKGCVHPDKPRGNTVYHYYKLY